MSDLFESLGLDPGIVIIFLFLVVVFFAVWVVRIHMRQSRLEKRYKAFMKGQDGQSLEKQFIRQFNQIDKLMEIKDNHMQEINLLKEHFNRLYSKYGVEKYDAFDDVGGKLSFVLALLDHENTGIILNAIHSRDNCFLYLKEIVKGESYVMLSQEEVEALRKAVNYGMEMEEE